MIYSFNFLYNYLFIVYSDIDAKDGELTEHVIKFSKSNQDNIKNDHSLGLYKILVLKKQFIK